jgi:DNA invertase Pin-like site-specific DNA recombinase
MKVLYVRCSCLEQKTDRQRVNESEYDFVIEDKVSGATDFRLRPGGLKILELLQKGQITELGVWQIDRLGRNLLEILKTIQLFSENGIPIYFISQGLKTLTEDGRENPISKLIINILGVVSEMERNQIRERQLQGITIAKARGVYKGRKTGTKEDVLTFLSKSKNKKAVELLKRGYKGSEVSKIVGVHPNTISKIKNLSGVSKLKIQFEE